MAKGTESGSTGLAGPGTAAQVSAGPVVGDQIARFRIERLIGAGGMGRVYAAHDPELDRTVAVKLLLGERWQAGSHRTRFVREARALARLRHPNVVTIHDSGEHEGQAYIAMELLEGSTLAAWLRAAPRGWREIRDAFLAAGRGLAAAHAAGLVHRDFKPANVVIGDGGVRVVDFGLALSASDASDSGEGSPALAEAVDLTRTGALVGTMGYLAPERLEGVRATPLSDQWSFCVALYEALYRRLPFPGGNGLELAAAMRAGLVLPPGPPRFLLAILRRGLSLPPADRYPSMAELLRELDRDPVRTAKRLGLAGGTLAAAAVTLAVLWPRTASPCEGARAHLDGIWDDGVRATLHAAFTATGAPYAEDVWQRTRARLDGYADSWTAAHTAACKAGRERGEQSALLLDRRMACLDRLKGNLRTWVTTVSANLDVPALQKVVGASGYLGAIADCADTATLLARAPRPADPALARRIDQLDALLTAAYARGRLQNPLTANQLVTSLMPEIEAQSYAPLLAQAKLTQGQLLAMALSAKQAALVLEEAIRAAVEAGDATLEARAWLVLLLALSDDRRPDEALRLSLAADTALRRVGSPVRLRREYELALALADRQKGRLAEARTRLYTVLPLYSGPDDALQRAKIYNMLGQIAAENEDADAILDTGRKLLLEVAASVGPDNLMAANGRQQLGAALMLQGDREGAIRELEEAARIYTLVLGPATNERANSYMIISLAHSRAGDLEAARKTIDHALEIFRLIPEPTTFLANALEQSGSVEQQLGHTAAAREAFERSLAIRQKILGDDHPLLAVSYGSLAGAFIDEGKPAEAVTMTERAVALLERLKVTDSRLATALLDLSRALREAGRAHEAVTAAERARGSLEDAEPTLRVIADLRLARALWDAGQDRPRARELAAAVRKTCAGRAVDQRVCDEEKAWKR